MDAGGEGESSVSVATARLNALPTRLLLSLYFLMSDRSSSVLKVKHLEVSCSSMAEDICRKSAIIETYVLDSRIGTAC